MLRVSPYFWRCIKLLPMDFTASTTDYEFLCSLVHKMNELIESNNNLVGPYNQLVEDVEALQAEVDKIENGDYEWLRTIITNAIQNVYFGLTEDGHFCAYIPESWSNVTFRTTGYDTELPCTNEFGHLVLMY